MKYLLFLILLISYYSSMDAQTYQSGDNDLIVMPTAETMPKGSVYISNYEILLFNIVGSVTNTTQLGFSFIIPVVENPGFIILSAKQQVYKNDFLSTSLFGAVSPAEYLYYTFGGIVSAEYSFLSVHAGIGIIVTDDNVLKNRNALFMGGVKLSLSSNIIVIGEYGNYTYENDESLLSAGVRFRIDHFNLDLAVSQSFRTSSHYNIFPILKMAYYF